MVSTVSVDAMKLEIRKRNESEAERKKLFNELQSTLSRIKTLYEISQTANKSLDLDWVLNSALDKVIDLLEVDGGFLRLLNENRQELVLNVHKGFTPKQISTLLRFAKPVSYKIGDTLIHQGDITNTAYLIESGTVKVIKDGKELAELSKRQLVGTVAAIHNAPLLRWARINSITATTKVNAVIMTNTVIHGSGKYCPTPKSTGIQRSAVVGIAETAVASTRARHSAHTVTGRTARPRSRFARHQTILDFRLWIWDSGVATLNL